MSIDPCPVEVSIGDGPSVSVTIPAIDRESVISLIAEFLSNGPTGVRQRPEDRIRNNKELSRVLGAAKEVTFTITTRCKPAPQKHS